MKTDDFIEDIHSLSKQYGLTSESANHSKWIKEIIESYEDKIHLYKALICGCETSITVWKNVAEKILKLNLNK